MSSLFAQLKNDQVVYDFLNRSGVMTGEKVPSLDEIVKDTGLDADTVLYTLERYRQQRLLEADGEGWFRQYPQPLFMHYKSFRAFRQLLESTDSGIKVELLSAAAVDPDGYTTDVLHLSPGERILHIMRLYTRNGVPFAYEEYDVPYDLMKNVPRSDLTRSSILQAIENSLPPSLSGGKSDIVQSQYFNLMPFIPDDQKYLQLTESDCVLRIIGRAYREEKPIFAYQIRVNPALCFLKHQARVPE